jgi:hypothetical protein
MNKIPIWGTYFLSHLIGLWGRLDPEIKRREKLERCPRQNFEETCDAKAPSLKDSPCQDVELLQLT